MIKPNMVDESKAEQNREYYAMSCLKQIVSGMTSGAVKG
jgi:hypothetical protein